MKLAKFLKIVVVGVACLFFWQSSYAQTTVQASIDSTMILIGEQTKVHLNVVTEKDSRIEWPVLTDTLTNKVFVLEKGALDTIAADNNRIQIRQDFLVTSFDSALYVLPPFKVISGTDTLQSNPLVLKVVTYPDIDPEKGFYDIKGILHPQWMLSDYSLYIWCVLIFFFLFATMVYILKKRKKAEPILRFKSAKPKLPPHVEAIGRLDKIKGEKIWQFGKNKEYYTDITDTLRTYIVDRFGINALEMTSDEILDDIYRLNDAHSTHETLKKVLELSDLVKFAKYVPLPNDNEVSLLNAYLFVNQTKIEELPNPEEETSVEKKNGTVDNENSENK